MRGSVTAGGQGPDRGGVVCPRCRGPLAIDDAPIRCRRCSATVPQVAGVPCLLPDPSRMVQQWRRRLAVIAAEGRRTVQMFEAEGRKPGLLASTRARLLAQARIATDVLAELVRSLEDAVGEPLADGGPTDPFTPLETLHFVHRDWGWPDSDENERTLACVQPVLPAELGRVLVLGCGGARLTYDLHRLGAAQTWALDIDPFVLSLARRILAGETVRLVEGRANATELDMLSAVRELRTPAEPAPEIRLVLADGLDPPFAEASFDTIVTPWFLDVVPPDLRDFLPTLRRLLAPQGQWLNFGPLLYPSPRPPALRFSRQEIFELCARVGLPVEAWVAQELPFARSPLTGRGRVESCIAFRARRAEARPSRPGQTPNWLVFPDLPIPATVVPRGAATAVARRIAELIDGHRSIDDIAKDMAAHLPSTPRAVVKDAIRECLQATIG